MSYEIFRYFFILIDFYLNINILFIFLAIRLSRFRKYGNVDADHLAKRGKGQSTRFTGSDLQQKTRKDNN